MVAHIDILAGKKSEGVIGIPRIGLKTAANILKSQGDTWQGVVNAYICAGLTEQDAIKTKEQLDGTYNTRDSSGS